MNIWRELVHYRRPKLGSLNKSKQNRHALDSRDDAVPSTGKSVGSRQRFGGRSAGSDTLARCPQCWHYASMPIQINIRDVPEKVRDELASRAAMQGKSMQEFLRAELERLAARPSIDAWLRQVRKRKRAAQTRISSVQILNNRNADRR
jgi:hypothetical protein